MANTRDIMGEQACLDALVADTLTSFEDDAVKKVGRYCLSFKYALKDLVLPQCTTIEPSGLNNSVNLETLDMLGSGIIDSYALSGCSGLRNLILRDKTTMTRLHNVGITDTAIAAGFGAVYVDSDMLSTYKANSSWKRYLIRAIDDYTIEEDFSTIPDSWPTIIANAEAGTAAESYELGDYKMIDLGTEGKVYAQIVGFGADTLASDSSMTAGITFVLVTAPASVHRMNPKYSSSQQGTGSQGGWEHSEMRTYLNDTILPMFPSELQQAIKTVTKYSNYTNPGSSSIVKNQETQDKLWIPSGREVFGGSSYETRGPIYSYFSSTAERKRRSQNARLTSCFLRSAKDRTNFNTINTSGSVYNVASETELDVIFGFCI